MKLFREKREVAEIDKKREPMEWWFGNPLLVIVFIFGFPWVTLGFMNVGVLVGSQIFYDGYSQENIRCEYFIGVSVVERTQLREDEPDCSLFADFKAFPADSN